MDVTNSASLVERQYGLDWLRIGAFAILIFYHIGMFFVPWGWHIKTAEPIEWLTWPMMAVNPWRLSLLFLISGIVSRSLIAKLASPSGFASSRSSRLLIPLIAGIAIFVVPQPWVELRDQGTYSQGLLHFWIHDYAEFGTSRGTPLPTWNHLWFVAYLWVYSMALAALACLPATVRQNAQEIFDQLFSGWLLIALPVAWLLFARAMLHPIFGETHALTDDPYGHAIYGFTFFFGVALARSKPAWDLIGDVWERLLWVAFAAITLKFTIQICEGQAQFLEALKAGARAIFAWTMILGLMGMAQKHLNYDGPTRRYLTEAIFPYYIAHQTIIVVVGYYVKQASVGPSLEFGWIMLSTLIGCFLTYEIGRRINLLRPFLGLKRLAETPNEKCAEGQPS
jgi:glucans biosynthesis protein C